MIKACLHCNDGYQVKPSHAAKSSYCGKRCMTEAYRSRLRGVENPNFKNAGQRICETCSARFKNYNKARRFCSLRCRSLAPGNLAKLKVMANMPRKSHRRGRPISRLDANHRDIVAALEAVGASVIDASANGFGCPDLIVGFRKQTFLIEIKNPKTSYGRKGLNENQKHWAENWRGGPVFVVYDQNEALRAIGAISPEGRLTT